MTYDQTPGSGPDVLLTRKEASRELLAMGIRRAPSTLAKIFCTRTDGPPCTHLGRTPYYPRGELHRWAREQLTELRSSSRIPRQHRTNLPDKPIDSMWK